MFRDLAAFEFRYQIRQPLYWGTAVVFAAMSFAATVTDALQLGGSIGAVNRNAPFVVVRMLGDLSLIGTFMVAAFVATSLLRDFERRTDELVFSRLVSMRTLLAARFAGSMLAACLCFAGAAIAMAFGSFMPWLDRERIEPFSPWPYLYGLCVLAYPTFIAIGGVLFAVASRTRRSAAVYASLVALLVAYFSATAMLTDLDSRSAAALLDPFGLSAFFHHTRYWTLLERNTTLPTVGGEILWNRSLWLLVGCSGLLWAIARFRYERPIPKTPSVAPAALDAGRAAQKARLRVRPTFTAGTVRAQLWSQYRVEIRGILRSIPFVLILAFGLINVLTNIGYLDLMMGTPVWPVTHLMLLAISAGYAFLLNFVLLYYAGEVVWRARDLSIDGMLDATPMPTWVPLAAKVLALWTAVGAFLFAGALGLVGYQLSKSYTHLEPGLYVQGLLIEAVPFLLTAVLAVFLQVVVNQKFVGYLLQAVFIVSSGALSAMHFDHHLYRFATAPAAPYSDMNGWGPFLEGVIWFQTYWSLVAGCLFIVAYLGWVRGSESAWRVRLHTATSRLRGRAGLVLPASILCAAAAGTLVFYNTNILNEYLPSSAAERRLAEYETKYGRYRRIPQPRITALQSSVDLYPDERRVRIRGTYRLVNRSGNAIDALHVAISPRLAVQRLDFPAHHMVVDDRVHGYAIYRLDTPLPPSGAMSFGFQMELTNPGYVNNGADTSVVENGSFFYSSLFPSFGYQESRELSDPAARRRHGLPPAVRMPKIGDLQARNENTLAGDADLIDFDTTISTSGDQIAIAPGDLQREWIDGGRRYFQYRSPAPIPKFFAFLSARYAVRHDTSDGTAIDIYYHPGHAYNIDRMMTAVKKTLQYMTQQFSPYQHQRLRIVEFPRYMRRAGSFPNTVPFSESLGFIARVTSPTAIDYPFYVTAHEVAHQWWGYQVMPADVQGAGMLSESMAQYSALMVMEHEYGPDQMRRFLKYELDGYLSGRGGEISEEPPLELVEDQSYVFYRKGSLGLYALKDYLGESVLNGALRQYIASVRDKSRPYTVSSDLLKFVAEVTPPDKRQIIDDLFRSITLFDLAAMDASATRMSDGRYDVTLRLGARKLKADGRGREVEVPIDDWIDVGVFGSASAGSPPPVLYLQKQHVTAGELTLHVVVSGEPARAGIDPYNKLIDRDPGDNTLAVSRQ